MNAAKILVVDDVALNVKLLADLLAAKSSAPAPRRRASRRWRRSMPSAPTSSCST